jgi:hypothetical protein
MSAIIVMLVNIIFTAAAKLVVQAPPVFQMVVMAIAQLVALLARIQIAVVLTIMVAVVKVVIAAMIMIVPQPARKIGPAQLGQIV